MLDIRDFVRHGQGWTCIRQNEHKTDFGVLLIRQGDHFKPGEIIKGIDVGTLLDRENLLAVAATITGKKIPLA